MLNNVVIAVFALFLGGCGRVVEEGSSSPEKVITATADEPVVEDVPTPRLLIYTVSAGYEHAVVKRPDGETWSIVEQALHEFGERSGVFEAVVSRDTANFDADTLATFDGIFFYTTGELPLSATQVENLLTYVSDGGAFIGAHCATDTFYEVPAFGEMIGGYFDGHPWNENVRVTVEQGDHPATEHLGDSFEIHDEIYQFKAPYSREGRRVLLSLDTAAVDMTKPGIKRTDGDFAIAWTRDHGEGRVFYTSLGHGTNVWTDPRFASHLIGGIRWALGAEGR